MSASDRYSWKDIIAVPCCVRLHKTNLSRSLLPRTGRDHLSSQSSRLLLRVTSERNLASVNSYPGRNPAEVVTLGNIFHVMTGAEALEQQRPVKR